MGRNVLLRHELPDGSHHFDWLIEPSIPSKAPDDPDAHDLIAWRLGRRLDEAAGADLPAERLPPHRRLYLDYEGPISGGRGRVIRVAAGEASISRDHATGFEAVVTLGVVRLRIRGQPMSREAWLLHIAAAGA